MSEVPDYLAAAEAKARDAEQAAARAETAAAAPRENSLWSRAPKQTAAQPQVEFNRAIVSAFLELVRDCRDALNEQHARVARIEMETGAVLAITERIHEMQSRTHALETRLDDEVAKNSAQQDQGRELIQALRNETRERVQALLDEQRVCLRQLALQTSEEAVLTDRARRATELRLDEMERRLAQSAEAATA